MSKALRDALKEAGFNEMSRRGLPKPPRAKKSQPAKATIVIKRSIKKLVQE
ncbi:hypothetical protein NVP2275O_121 [Vibrio phage 2.275.O._10N.286.54.E11]|nr:hypothetical protein NVP2275O_121 [Vibrio phage 2.275.O._10N.286.54.E11]